MMVDNFLKSKTGKWPYWICYWPIAIHKAPFTLGTHYNALRLLRRCNINAKGGALKWLFFSTCWVYVPRKQAQRAETILKHYGYKIGGRNLV